MSHDANALVELFRTATLGGPENAIGFVLWRVVGRYTREVDRALAAAGVDLTHLQFETLIQAAWLGRDGDAPTQLQLAGFGGIQPMQVSLMVKTLERKGLVSRPRAARTKRVELTAAGIQMLYRAKPVVIEVQRCMFGEEGAPGGSLLLGLLKVCSESNDSKAIE